MMAESHKVAWIVHSPTPYKTPFFKLLASSPELNMKYYFLYWDDPQRPWSQDSSQGFIYRVLPGFSIRKRLKEKAYVHCGTGIIKELWKEKFDLVVICGYDHPTLMFALFYCLVTATPFVLQGESHVVRRRHPLKQLLKKYLLFPLLRSAQAAFATGTKAREYWVSTGIPSENTYIVSNTPDIRFFIEASQHALAQREKVRKDLGFDSRRLGIYVGRFVDAKRVDVVLHALARMEPESRPQLLLVGDGPLRAQLMEIVKRHDLPVRFMGFCQREQLPDLYAAADFFVLPSQSEPWGVVVNEAMASGLPVLLSDQVGAAYDLLAEAENGFMIPTGDIEAWKVGIQQIMMLDRDSLKRMGARSREIVKPWTHEANVANVLKCVKQVCRTA